MLKRSIFLILALALILVIPPQGQARPDQKIRIGETIVRKEPPPIKITPRPDGKFFLEPLAAPPKARIPPSSPAQKGDRNGHPLPTSMIAPCDISNLVLSKVRKARYAWGASLENGSGTDCSGFTRFIYRACGIDLPRSSADQAQVGQEVARWMDFSKLEAGDLLFFRQGGTTVGHAGIYLGEGKMIHATRSGGGVEVTQLDQGYYLNNFVVAKRVFEKQYKWPTHPGLSPATRYRDWGSPVLAPFLAPRPLRVIVSKLLKIFWPGKYQGWDLQV